MKGGKNMVENKNFVDRSTAPFNLALSTLQRLNDILIEIKKQE